MDVERQETRSRRNIRLGWKLIFLYVGPIKKMLCEDVKWNKLAN